MAGDGVGSFPVDDVQDIRAAWLAERARAERAEAERDEARQERADALNVTSRDGLLSSEWVLRTGKAERERDTARARLCEALEFVPTGHPVEARIRAALGEVTRG